LAQDNVWAPASSGDTPAGLPHTPALFVSSASGGEVFVWNGYLVDFRPSARPDAANRPHMISANVMAYTDGNGVAQQVMLKSLPTSGSTFGNDANGNPNNGALVNSGGVVTVTVDGTVLDGYIFNDTINVQANNITIKTFRLSGGTFGINIDYRQNVTGTLIQDGEMYGSSHSAIYGHDFIAQRLNIHDEGSDGIVASGNNGGVLACYFHDLGTLPGAHADGVQISGGTNWLIRGNNFDLPEKPGHLSNAGVFLESYFGPTSNVTLDGNWLNGGNYSVFSRDNDRGYGTPSGVHIINNLFGRDYNYGLLSTDADAVIKWTNNRWVDTNAVIPSAFVPH
jgi:hypothetical protein